MTYSREPTRGPAKERNQIPLPHADLHDDAGFIKASIHAQIESCNNNAGRTKMSMAVQNATVELENRGSALIW